MGFLLGALAGAAVALLCAPATGEEARRYVADRAREGRDKANEVARQGRDLINRSRDTVQTAVDRGREAYREARGALVEKEHA